MENIERSFQEYLASLSISNIPELEFRFMSNLSSASGLPCFSIGNDPRKESSITFRKMLNDLKTHIKYETKLSFFLTIGIHLELPNKCIKNFKYDDDTVSRLENYSVLCHKDTSDINEIPVELYDFLDGKDSKLQIRI